MTNGIDYAFSPHPSIRAIKAAGYSFVCRYTSAYAPNDVNGKNLLKPELDSLLNAGLSVVIVAEENAGRMRSGWSAGVTDAQHADAVVKALGMAGMPIYFACDFDSTENDQTAINAYLEGAASVIGHARVGIYGGYYSVSRAMSAGKASYAWQTFAWSGGQWYNAAHIRQGSEFTLDGADCDKDTSMAPDFGQFPRPKVAVTSVRVPDLAGQSCGQAHNTLVDMGLVPTAAPLQQADDTVASTNPAAGTSVNTGSSVEIVGTVFHGEYVTGGMFDLQRLADKLGTGQYGASALLRMTATHYGSFGDVLGAHIRDVFNGTIPWDTPVPPGVKLWVD